METIKKYVKKLAQGEDLKIQKINEFLNICGGDVAEIIDEVYLIIAKDMMMYNPRTDIWESLKSFGGAMILTPEAVDPEEMEEYFENTGGETFVFIDPSCFSDETQMKLVLLHEVGHKLAYHIGGDNFLSQETMEEGIISEAAADIIAIQLMIDKLGYERESIFNMYSDMLDTLLKKSNKLIEDEGKKAVKLNTKFFKNRKSTALNFQNNDLKYIVEGLSAIY